MSKHIRKPVFRPRSALPSSAACIVANGVRETLTSIFSSPVEMRVFEPSIPAPPAWPAIVKDAVLYRVRGSIADAAIVLRSADALSLVAALFGEGLPVDPRRELSPIERDVLDRTVNAIAAHLGSVCGNRESRCVERVGTIEGYATYFELLVEEPVAARIGIALSRDPSPGPRGCVEIGHLAAVPITARDARSRTGPKRHGSRAEARFDSDASPIRLGAVFAARTRPKPGARSVWREKRPLCFVC